LGIENIFPKQTHGINNIPHITVKEIVDDLKDLWISYNPQKHNGEIIHNHIATTNVHDKFWGRKHKVNQHDICDYLKYWRNKKGI
jgi:DNA (cytosine-5)-methyltransferase 1